MDKTTEKLMEKLRDLSGRVQTLEASKLEIQKENDRLREALDEAKKTKARNDAKSIPESPQKESSDNDDALNLMIKFASQICTRFDRHLENAGTAVTGAIENLNAGEDILSERLREIRRIINGIISLNYRLFEIGGKQDVHPEPVNVNSFIADIEGKVASSIPSRIHFTTYLTPNLKRISADPRQLEKALFYIISFACNSMPSGGRLNVESSETSAAGTGKSVTITIRDNGFGFGIDSLKTVFEPFFPESHGFDSDGLELTCAYGIIRQMGGALSVSSEPSRGTAYQLNFTAIEEAENEDSNTDSPGFTVKGADSSRKTILCVDDEEIVREVVKEILEKAGFRVKTASGSADAFQAFESLEYKPDLAIIDVIMPGMDGMELSREMKKINPHLKILFMSGYVSDIRRAENDGIINKPFKSQGLLDKVVEILGK